MPCAADGSLLSVLISSCPRAPASLDGLPGRMFVSVPVGSDRMGGEIAAFRLVPTAMEPERFLNVHSRGSFNVRSNRAILLAEHCP